MFDGSKPGPGRPRGSQNKMTTQLKAWVDQYGDQWVNAVWTIATTADKDSDRLKALDILGKKVVPDLKSIEHSGELDTQPQKSVDLSDLSTDELLVIQKVLSTRKNS